MIGGCAFAEYAGPKHQAERGYHFGTQKTCYGNGIRDAAIRGSLIGARCTDGSRVDDHAAEVLVRQGRLRNSEPALKLLVVDMQGAVHRGWLERGENPVCITFDLVLEVAAGGA